MGEQNIPVIRTPVQAKAHKAYLESLKSEQKKGIKVTDDDSVTIQDCYSISGQKDNREKIAEQLFLWHCESSGIPKEPFKEQNKIVRDYWMAKAGKIIALGE